MPALGVVPPGCADGGLGAYGATLAAGDGGAARPDVSEVEGRLGRLPRPPEEDGGGRGGLKRCLPPVARPGRRRRGAEG
eukprot:8461634-Alexandrium_andersonii.AAC.1